MVGRSLPGMRWRVAQALSKSWLQPAAAATPPTAAAAAVTPSGGCRSVATAAQDGLQGDIIAPDVGLARIDGWVAAACSVALRQYVGQWFEDASCRPALCPTARAGPPPSLAA